MTAIPHLNAKTLMAAATLIFAVGVAKAELDQTQGAVERNREQIQILDETVSDLKEESAGNAVRFEQLKTLSEEHKEQLNRIEERMNAVFRRGE